MSILERCFASEVSDFKNPKLWLTDAFVARTASGEQVTPEAAMSLAAYFAAIRAISEDVAKLPFPVYRRLEPRGKQRLSQHPVHRMLNVEANPTMGAMAFRETMQHWALGWGNGYAEIVRDGNGDVRELWPIHPSRVSIEVVDGNRRAIVYHVRANRNVGQIELRPDQVFHLYGLGGDGLQGYSVARVGAESIGLGLASEEFGNRFFSQGVYTPGVLETPQTIRDQNQIEKLRVQFAQMYENQSGKHKPLLLDADMKWKDVRQVNPSDAQLLTVRQFTIEEIARWFRIPPHKLQHLLRATFNNIESLNIQYVVDTLQSWFERWEQEVARKLLDDEEDVFAEHVANALLRGDSKSRSEYYSRLWHVGTFSQNDIRSLENENPIEGGDVYYVPKNMVRTEDAASGKAEPAKNDKRGLGAERDDENMRQRRQERDDQGADAARAILPIAAAAFSRIARRAESAVDRLLRRHAESHAMYSAKVGEFFDGELAIADEMFEPISIAIGGVLGIVEFPIVRAPRDCVEAMRAVALGAEPELFSGAIAGFDSFWADKYITESIHGSRRTPQAMPA